MGCNRRAARCPGGRLSGLLSRRDARLSAAVRFHAGSRWARRPPDRPGAAAARRRRRSERPANAQGYSTPADARAFLQMARQRTRLAPDRVASTNPIGAGVLSRRQHGVRRPRCFRGGLAGSRVGARAVIGSQDARCPRRSPRGCGLAAGTAAAVARRPRLGAVARHVRSEADGIRTRTRGARIFTRSHELAFLTNTLIAGCAVQSRPFTPQEASEAVVGICNLALEHWPARWPGSGTQVARGTQRIRT